MRTSLRTLGLLSLLAAGCTADPASDPREVELVTARDLVSQERVVIDLESPTRFVLDGTEEWIDLDRIDVRTPDGTSPLPEWMESAWGVSPGEMEALGSGTIEVAGESYDVGAAAGGARMGGWCICGTYCSTPCTDCGRECTTTCTPWCTSVVE